LSDSVIDESLFSVESDIVSDWWNVV